MSSTGLSLAVAVFGLWLAVTPCAAQPLSPSVAGPLEFGVSGVVTGGAALGGAAATLTSNLGSAPYTVFTTSASLGIQRGADIRLGYRIGRGVVMSVATGLGRSDVSVAVSGDAEGAPNSAFAGETLLQWSLEGRVDVSPPRWIVGGGRVRPYLMGSGGILRQYHGPRVSHESGALIQAGGGIRYGLRRRPTSRLSGMGVTVEVRLCHVRGGFNWGQSSRTTPVISVGLLTQWGRP
jgi:hypothetical protein